MSGVCSDATYRPITEDCSGLGWGFCMFSCEVGLLFHSTVKKTDLGEVRRLAQRRVV